jgi:hypothetical protein
MVSADPHAWITLQRAIIGYRLSFALGVAARLGIADLLRDGPRPVEELATASGSNADALRRVLRLLASEGYFEERDADMFALTVAAELLRSDVVGSMRERAIIEAEEWARAWADLGHSVATGQPSFERQFGTPLFDYYRREPAAAARFDAAMTSMTTHVTPALVEAMDLSDEGTVVDVGGGHGTLLRAMLESRPRLRGVLFDLPHVVEGARAVLEDVLDRCDLVGGDFFAAVPGGDVYVLKFIMDDWGPRRQPPHPTQLPPGDGARRSRADHRDGPAPRQHAVLRALDRREYAGAARRTRAHRSRVPRAPRRRRPAPHTRTTDRVGLQHRRGRRADLGQVERDRRSVAWLGVESRRVPPTSPRRSANC